MSVSIDHTGATSGLAGLIKSILVLKHQQIPPNLNFIEPKLGLNQDERQISVIALLHLHAIHHHRTYLLC
jgi:acyl transferase domain-containing protein